MKILINSPNINPRINVSGISSVTNLIMTNNRVHYYIHIVVGKPDNESNYLNKFVRILSYYFQWHKLLKKVDLIHFNLPLGGLALLRDYPMIRCAIRKQKKIILHLHGGELLFNKTPSYLLNHLMRKLFTIGLPVIVLSHLEKNQLINNYNSERVTILHNAVDVTGSSKYSNNNKEFLNVLFMGRFHESKGIDDIIGAFRILNRTLSKYYFTLCGQGPEEERINKIFKSLLGDRFIFKGVVQGEEKLSILESAGIFLLPSRYGEGLPVALLESMSYGVIPIVTDDASISTIVKNNINGFVVPKYNSGVIAEKIIDIVDNREKALKLSFAAKKEIEDNYNMDAYLSKLNNIYEGAIL